MSGKFDFTPEQSSMLAALACEEVPATIDMAKHLKLVFTFRAPLDMNNETTRSFVESFTQKGVGARIDGEKLTCSFVALDRRNLQYVLEGALRATHIKGWVEKDAIIPALEGVSGHKGLGLMGPPL